MRGLSKVHMCMFDGYATTNLTSYNFFGFFFAFWFDTHCFFPFAWPWPLALLPTPHYNPIVHIPLSHTSSPLSILRYPLSSLPFLRSLIFSSFSSISQVFSYPR